MCTGTKILFIEDNERDLDLMHYELHKAGIIYTSEVVQCEREYTKALKNFVPDIILSDYYLPQFDGPSAFKIREEHAPGTPFIFVSGAIGEENSIEYIKNGVTDYVFKDKLFTLVTKLKRALKESKEKEEKKITEQVLIESGKRLARAQQIAHMGSWELNFATQQVQCSEEACRIYGLLPEENIQAFEAWQSYIHPHDVGFVQAAHEEALKNHSNTCLDHRIILKDRSIKYVYSESRVEYDQNQVPVGLYGIVYDVSERKIAEEKLIKSEANLKEAQALAMLGRWEVDLINDIPVWSDEVYNILGVSKNEMSPSRENFMSFFHPDDVDDANSKIDEGLKSCQNITFDFRFIRGDGEVRYGYSEWKFKYDKDGKPETLMGIIQDITDRKLAEIERIRMYNGLMLRNKELEQFAYIVSHNLRAPVANILGAIKIMNQHNLSTEREDILRHGLSESVTALDNVVSDLTDILRVKHAVNDKKEKVLFSGLVNEIKVNIKNLIETYNVNISYNFYEIEGFITIRSYCYSIFYNLITNSIKYSRPEIGCMIRIKSQLKKDRIIITFTDNGMGIDLEKKGDQVFGLYKRFHPQIEGKGLGLCMVKAQVQALGGKINIHSNVNQGTKFEIEFQI